MAELEIALVAKTCATARRITMAQADAGLPTGRYTTSQADGWWYSGFLESYYDSEAFQMQKWEHWTSGAQKTQISQFDWVECLGGPVNTATTVVV